MKQQFRGIRPDDLHGRAGLRNPERGFRTEMYFSCIPGEIAGTCSCHSKRNKLDGRSEMPVFQNIDVPGVPHLIRGNRLDGVEFSHAQWQDEIDFLAYDGVSVMQSYCFLNRYDDGRDLPQSKLDDIEAFFAKVRAAGVKLLLRFAYELSPTLTGPTAETTLKHIRQLAPLLQRNKDVIYVLQCGFVGKFGEWHNSCHALQDDVPFRRELLDTVLSVLPKDRYTMMRYPALKMSVYGTDPISASDAFSGAAAARIGHFNDGFMAGPNHGGTFSRGDSLVPKEAEMAYLEQESNFLPMDGELFWRDLSGMALPADAAVNFSRWHYDTFGMVHGNALFEGKDGYSMDVWARVPVDPMFLRQRNLPFEEEYFTDEKGNHVWRSYYEYIRDHLGYRIVLEEAEVDSEIAAGQEFHATVKLRNHGFSAPVNPRPVQLVLKGREAAYRFDFKTDVRRWSGGGATQTLKLSAALPPDMAPGEYQIGFALPDAAESLAGRPEYAIRCANPLVFADGVNWLEGNVIIHNA